MSTVSTINPVTRLRETSAAVRVSFTWFGVRKALSAAQTTQAADTFQAEGEYLSARKKLIDTKHDAFKAVTAVKGLISAYWKSVTLPYPEPGIRLIKQESITEFENKMNGFKSDLENAVESLESEYQSLQDVARERLGTLFNPADYPLSLVGLFDVEWDYPNVEAPDYLKDLNPRLYEQERDRVANRFNEACALAEQAFFTEFAKLTDHLTDRLQSNPDGTRKTFRDSSINNLKEFFDRFRTLNVGSSEQLDTLVLQAEKLVSGIDPAELRNSDSLRENIASKFADMQSTLDTLIVDRPRRRIIKGSEQAAA
jgi:hypothetical protein